jgi:hypothetical protein
VVGGGMWALLRVLDRLLVTHPSAKIDT